KTPTAITVTAQPLRAHHPTAQAAAETTPEMEIIPAAVIIPAAAIPAAVIIPAAAIPAAVTAAEEDPERLRLPPRLKPSDYPLSLGSNKTYNKAAGPNIRSCCFFFFLNSIQHQAQALPHRRFPHHFPVLR